MESYAVYIHIPFCRHRCAYCDFNTYEGKGNLIHEYIDALHDEIISLRDVSDERFSIHSIYFGGGTPSLLPAFSLAKILHTLDACFDISPESEISIEANPGTLSLSYLQDLFAIGINRLSLGIQSAHPMELAFLERQHSFDDVLESVLWSRQAGIENLNLDMIYGLPEQQIEIWRGSLGQALKLEPEHFSLYALTIEEGTRMHHWAERGLIPIPNPDLAAEMYELAVEMLSASGYVQYEISNWAQSISDPRMGKTELGTCDNSQSSALVWRCRHNLQYWRNQPYFGFGAGAHGFAGGVRTSNVLTPEMYIQRLGQPATLSEFPRTPATIHVQSIDPQTEMNETMMMGLRLTCEGVSRARFQARFHQDMTDVFGAQIEKLVSWGLLRWIGSDEDILCLTPRGRLLGNRVFREFI